MAATDSGFQTQINEYQAPGVPGSFASTNPYTVVLAGQFGIVAGSAGVRVGAFAWVYNPDDTNGAPAIASNLGNGTAPAGIAIRAQQGIITAYLSNASQVIRQGFPVTLIDNGDLWVTNTGSTQAITGMKAYANFADGNITFAAAASATTGGNASNANISAGSGNFTGYITDDVLTVTALGTGNVTVGSLLSGGNIATGTTVVTQLTGNVGNIGTYAVNIPEQNTASTVVSGTWGILNINTLTSGSFGIGDIITGNGTLTNTFITALGTGTGGTGSYIVNLTQTVANSTLIAQSNYETKWYARSSGLTGEAVKISSWTQG